MEEFWADKVVCDLKARLKQDKRVAEIVKKHGFIVNDSKTPSGRIHIGSGRGWIIHDIVAKALRDAGFKAKFLLGYDDFDPFTKVPAYLDEKEFKKYLGVPLRNIPYKGTNYAHYFFMECAEKFPEFGIECEIYSLYDLYKSGKMNEMIKLMLDNHKKVQSIYRELYGESVGAGKLPFNPLCPKCGKIATTVAYEWDKKNEVVKYKCSEDLVKWARGCGYEGEMSPYNGAGKLPWKVEWACRWKVLGVTYETGGKDHFALGGSRSFAVKVAERIINYPSPYPSKGENIGQGYEWFIISGRKMSTSKGIGISFVEATNFAPAYMLRYLLVKTKPKSAVDLEVEGTNKIPLLYESYDYTERVYFGAEKVANKKELAKLKRIYELSRVGKIPSRLPTQVPFGFASMIGQITLDEQRILEILKRTGHIKGRIPKWDFTQVLERIKYAAYWARKYAPSEYRIVVNEVPPKIKLSPEIKDAISVLGNYLSKGKRINVEKLNAKIFELAKKTNVKEFFKACYNIILSSDRGPRLAPFIMAVGPKKIAKLFASIS